MNASLEFKAGLLRFGMTGEGVAFDPATGMVSIETGRLAEGVLVTLVTEAGGVLSTSRFRLALAALAAPALLAPPALPAAPRTGEAVEVDPGRWSGDPVPALAFQWLRDGAEIPGATGASYVPGAADDGASLACRVTAANDAGTAAAVTPARTVTRPAPIALGGLADLELAAGGAPAAVAAAAAFAGEALVFAVAGGGATIDSVTGLVTIATDALLENERITVTATNSGGSASSGFQVSVRATPPSPSTAPVLSGSGRIGAPVVVDPGTWEGQPAPVLAFAWLRDGAEIPGATATGYTPVPADDRTALACRVTATNPAGSVAALTAPLAVTRVPPQAVATLPDVRAELGQAAVAVAAAAAFAGEALVFAVEGRGATVDPATGRIAIATDALLENESVTVTATNSGGQASAAFRVTIEAPAPLYIPPLLLAAPALAGTAKIGQALTVSNGTWGGVPSPSLACQWLRDGAEIPGATGASYTPAPADDRTALSCRVTATNPGGRAVAVTAALPVSYVAPVARGELLEEIFDQGSGLQTVAAATDFEGENLAFSVEGAGATVHPATGLVSIPTDTALSATVVVTAMNSGGQATSAFPVTVEAAGPEEPVPFALAAEHIVILRSEWRPAGQEVWFSPVLRFPGLAGETVAAIEWTTSASSQVPDDQFEVMGRIGLTESFALRMRDAAKNLPGAKPRVDFSVWRADETRRNALRFRWKRTAEGPWSPLSPKLSVPLPDPAGTQWVPLISRNEGQFQAGLIGGPGLQFLRDFATTPADPNLILCPMDQNFPWQTKDFGASFHTPRWQGLWVGRSGLSAWIDPEDPNRQLLMYTAASQAFDKKFDAYSGVYLSTDGGETARLVLSLRRLTGTTVARHNMSLFAHAPGGTPDTRTLYAMQVSHGDTAAAETIQLWQSQDGGGTWTARGDALAPETYADGKNAVWGIAVAPNGDLYQWGAKGAWRSAAGANVGLAWTKLSSLPAGKAVHLMDVAHGQGVVWAAVEDSGLYKATDGTSFTRNAAFGAADIRAFGISPRNRNHMVACKVKVGNQFWSQDGGATWTQGESLPVPGQGGGSGHRMGNGDHYGVVPKPDDEMTWFFQRSQHLGISRDGGKTIEWTGRYYDGTDTHDIGFHPTDWQTFALAQQDRSLVLTRTGGNYWLEDPIGGPGDKSGAAKEIIDIIGESDNISGAGTFIHANGRIVTQQGFMGRKVLCVLYPKDDDPIGNCLVTSNRSNISRFASLDPNDGDSGFSGSFRISNLNAASVKDIVFTEMEYAFFGASGGGGSTVIYGGTKSENLRTIWRSTDLGASWQPWLTTSASFRPVDSTPVIAVCPHHPARLYAPSDDGRVVSIEGETSPVEKVIFDARDHLSPERPKYAISSLVVDPNDEDLLYVSLFMWGGPNVFRSTDRGASWTDVSGNVPSLDGTLYIHPLTSEVFFGSSHGTWVLAPTASHRAAFKLSDSVAQRAAGFLQKGQ